jgi:glutathione reductase (NADPH)
VSTERAAYDYDLAVIGGGSGGLAGAFRAASHGARVALLEPGEFGGTCVNVGCVPKKAMWLAAELAQRIDMASRLGFGPRPSKLDWREFIVHRQRYIAGIHDSYRKRLDAAGIVHLPCRGHFIDAHTLETHQGLRISAEHVLIATGGAPWRPDIPGAELGLVSDDFFNLCDAPERVAIVGGGYIAVELGGVLQALGSKVELFVRGPRLLDSFDTELSDELAENLRQHGIHCHFAHRTTSLQKSGEQRLVHGPSGQESESFDSVIFATGRRPNSGRLGLEDIGVAVDGGGFVVVDELQNTSLANVHAVGDVSSRLALTPVAIAAARRLMDRLFGGDAEAKLDYDDIATVVFAHPPLGMVGLTEAQARERHGDARVKTYSARFRPMLHALADSPQRSLFKLVCVGEDERVIGIHLLGEGADEMLQGFAVALKKGITKRDLDDTMAIHPTSAEEVVLMR